MKNCEFSVESLPVPNKKFWIVLDSKDQAQIILKTIKVEINPYNKVTKVIAIAEGEGDLSLEYWKKAHEDFFKPFLLNWGLNSLEEANVVTEYFCLVYKKQSECSFGF